MAKDAKVELIQVLDRRAFHPVIQADERDYPDDKRRQLREMKEAIEREQDRFDTYDSAQQVYEMYHSELSSEEARKMDQMLRDLDLPTLADCRAEFEQTALRLGIH